MSFIVPESRRLVHPGQRFSKLEIAGVPFYLVINGKKQQYVVVFCECGRHFMIRARATRRQTACIHCGHARHGMSSTQVWRAWRSMRQRCEDINHGSYPRYGGRGISVCIEWQTFEPFRDWSIANGFSAGLSIDRINNDGNYEPSNCRWVDMKTQQNNRSTCRRISMLGESKTISEWGDDARCAVPNQAFRLRLAAGWEPVVALLSKPGSVFRKRRGRRFITAFGETKSASDWAADKRCAVSRDTLLARLNDGWPNEKAISAPSRYANRSA